MDSSRYNILSGASLWLQSLQILRLNPLTGRLLPTVHTSTAIVIKIDFQIKTSPPKVIWEKCVTLTQLCNKVPTGYNGTPQIHPKTAPSPSTATTPSSTPIPQLTPVTTPYGI